MVFKKFEIIKKNFIIAALFKNETSSCHQGRVKEVTENYTQNFTPPTAGFDCHVSEQLRSVCTTTSSFLAFERTQVTISSLSNSAFTHTQTHTHLYQKLSESCVFTCMDALMLLPTTDLGNIFLFQHHWNALIVLLLFFCHYLAENEGFKLK